MLDDRKRAELDQASAALTEAFPPLWRNLYLRCVEEGFAEEEALALVKAYIIANGKGVTL